MHDGYAKADEGIGTVPTVGSARSNVGALVGKAKVLGAPYTADSLMGEAEALAGDAKALVGKAEALLGNVGAPMHARGMVSTAGSCVGSTEGTSTEHMAADAHARVQGLVQNPPNTIFHDPG